MTHDPAGPRPTLRRGILPVVQTPFNGSGALDEDSLIGLVRATLDAGACGFLVPAVASEVSFLTPGERLRILGLVIQVVSGRVPILAGCSSDDAGECVRLGLAARDMGAAAFLAAVPQACYRDPGAVLPFFESIASGIDFPLVVQDLEWSGPGLSLSTIEQLAARIPTLVGLKVETVPAGPKYTAVRRALGPGFFIAGGWAAPQMIEALDRGVDAMIPECSMVAVYDAVFRLHQAGARDEAVRLFRALLPVLAFSNQEIRTSIAFFKRLLVRKGIFAGGQMRGEPFAWDEFNARIADELIEHYLDLEAGCLAGR
jgi:4-hydroxy-tetrahydrodipicolinate synthase